MKKLPFLNNYGNVTDVSFRWESINNVPQSTNRVALLVTSEYEGIFRNGGIGTYYCTLSKNLAMEGFYVVLLLCQSQGTIVSKSTIPAVGQVFLTSECKQVLDLQPTHQALLSQLKPWEWVTYESYCALFFTQAIAKTFPHAYIYIEFPEMLGFGYQTIQAKRAGILGENCAIAVTLHSGQEWLSEAHEHYTQASPQWFWQTSHYEQYSFEHADLAFFLSHYLKGKVEKYGWKTEHALHLPYCFPVIEATAVAATSGSNFQLSIKDSSIPLVFFGRLEERKGLLTFLESLQLLDRSIIENIHIVFLGKNVELHTTDLQGLDSQDSIQQVLGKDYQYSIVTHLFSQDAIQLINRLNNPVVCLTSHQENFPNAALEMGQLPISLIVTDTGGFRETLSLIGRTQGVHWFSPKDSNSLAKTITQVLAVHPEKISAPHREFLHFVNRRLLNQRLEYMRQASPKMEILSEGQTNNNQPRGWILGMTSMEEQIFLESYAQNNYSGRGEIVELGCWFGSSTISLAMGLKKNSLATKKDQRIHVYDLFIWDSSMEKSLINTSLQGRYKDGDSFLDEYLERTLPWQNLIKVYPSDLTQMSWSQGEIECLFIDAMKSWKLAKSITNNFFPYLIPEVSLVVHQDFAHYYTAWIHLLMYRLREYLIPIEHPFIYSSRVFQFVNPISDRVLQGAYSFDSFTEAEVKSAFAYSLDITPEEMRPNVLAAKVMYFIHIRDFEAAKIEFKKAVSNLDSCDWLELADVQKAASTYFGVDLLK